MGDNIITLETLYVSIQDAFKDLREQVVTLREHSARRNGYVESIDKKLAELQAMVSDRPCNEHAKQLEDVRLKLTSLEKDEGQDKKRWERVTDAAWEIGKYVITFLIGAVLAYAWFKLTGVAP